MAEANNHEEPVRAPSPESVDQTKSVVTSDQIVAMEKAAPQPHRPEREDKEEKGAKKTAKK